MTTAYEKYNGKRKQAISFAALAVLPALFMAGASAMSTKGSFKEKMTHGAESLVHEFTPRRLLPNLMSFGIPSGINWLTGMKGIPAFAAHAGMSFASAPYFDKAFGIQEGDLAGRGNNDNSTR